MSTFGSLLRRARIAANMSQEALADAAQMRLGAISAYERGLRNAPHRESLLRLTNALRLTGEARTEFEEAARRKARLTADDADPAPRPMLGNLPFETTSFIGRDGEIEELVARLNAHRLVTVTGSGGLGKTRIALRVATRLSKTMPDGCWLVDFSTVSAPADVIDKIASVLNLPGGRFPDATTEFADRMKPLRALLVFDNCEHLLEAAGNVAAAVVRTCPLVTILATSRQRLRVTSEVVYALSTFDVPEATPKTAVEARDFAAVELFLARAGSADRHFVFHDVHVELVTEICRRLDGVPLAIELAAAHVSSLGLTALRDQLHDRLNDASKSFFDLPARQRTLWATIEWSFMLLDEHERVVCTRLSVFAGGGSLDAARHVCIDPSLQTAVFERAMSSLSEKSLVTTSSDRVGRRFSMLESVRLYAQDSLGEEERSRLARRHAEWCAQFALGKELAPLEMIPDWWRLTVQPELPNVFKGLAWALGVDGDATLAGQIVGGLRNTWVRLHRMDEMLALADRILTRLDREEDPAIIARLELARAVGLYRDPESMIAALLEAIRIREALGDKRGLIACYLHLARAYGDMDRYDELEPVIDRAWDLAVREKMFRVQPTIMLLRVDVLRARGELRSARAQLLVAAQACDADGNLDWYDIQHVLALIDYELGDPNGAVEREEHCATTAREAGVLHHHVTACNRAAAYAIIDNQLDRAERFARETLRATQDRDVEDAVYALQHLASVYALRGDVVRAAALLGYVDHWFESPGRTHFGGPYDASRRRALEKLGSLAPEADLSVYRRAGFTLVHARALEVAVPAETMQHVG